MKSTLEIKEFFFLSENNLYRVKILVDNRIVISQINIIDDYYYEDISLFFCESLVYDQQAKFIMTIKKENSLLSEGKFFLEIKSIFVFFKQVKNYLNGECSEEDLSKITNFFLRNIGENHPNFIISETKKTGSSLS